MTMENCQLTRQSDGLEGKRILVVGFRLPIVDMLNRLDVPYAVWNNQPIKRTLKCLKFCGHPFPSTAEGIRKIAANEFSELGPFTDVIAGTEASVYVASVCRRVLEARKSTDSIALRCSDKQHMKELMARHDVAMTDFVTQGDALSAEAIFERLGPKVVMKQRRNSGGRGVTIGRSAADLEARKERGLLYERFIDAREMSIESFIRDGEIQYTSTTNYLVKTQANIVPANLPEDVLKRAHELNRRVIEALKLKWGLTHSEFYWDDDRVLFGEIALRPPGGYIMECISLAGNFDAWEAFVANELDLKFTFPGASKRSAGVAMIHAGEGTVTAILGQREICDLPSCRRIKILVKPGDHVSARTGVGEVSAYAIFVSDNQRTTTADVMTYLNTLQFQLAGDQNQTPRNAKA